ncbi:ATP-binding cassette domain-containing protein [Micromonospora sp. GCM10011542]|uniref:ATP-binding cassette domain-containing protein n=1 Tax=Micromonospora sp. GCM10011542 TaxID=3317337 RepID=UPI00360D08D6
MVVVEASGLGLRTRRGWVFRDVDLAVGAGELHAVTGPPGSGRTSLLLALAGRFPTSEGRLVRHGSAALGQVAGVHEPDPELTVAEHVAERLLLLGRRARLGGERRRRAAPLAALRSGRLGRSGSGAGARSRRTYRRDAVAAATDGAGLGGEVALDPATRGRDLTPVQRQVLGLVLAALAGPDLIVADDIDAGTDGVERAWLWAVLARLAEQGYAVVASARAVEPGTAAIVHRLGEPSPTPAPAPRSARADHATTGPVAASAGIAASAGAGTAGIAASAGTARIPSSVGSGDSAGSTHSVDSAGITDRVDSGQYSEGDR